MKKVISMFLFLIILPFETSIAEQNKLLPTEPKFILDKDMVILISPSTETIFMLWLMMPIIIGR